MTEGELLHLCKGNSIQGFELLYDTYASCLYSITLTIIPDPQIAVQALQETFDRIWTDLSHFDPEKMRLFTWMYQITRTTALYYHQTSTD